MQFYWINLISDTFTEISKNSTERAIKILDIRGKLQTYSFKDYAWHFNMDQKLQVMQWDIDELKESIEHLGNNSLFLRQ